MSGVIWSLLIGVAGCGLIAALAHFFGFSVSPTLADEADARGVYDRESPYVSMLEIAIAKDGQAALAKGEDGSINLLTTNGSRWVLRKLDKGGVRRIEPGDGAIILRLNDYTVPKIVVRLDDGQARNWTSILEAAL